MQIKVKRGTDVASKTLAQGELGFATDVNKLYIGTSNGKIVVGPQQWGDIGGSLANQSDLVAVLANKVDEPVNEGTNGQVLTTDGNGGRTWTTVSGGSTQWGDITGTLSNQTDLNTALSAKYSKPSSGIPATDLSSEVQTALESEIFWATYNTTTAAEISSAIAANKLPLVNYDGRIYTYITHQTGILPGYIFFTCNITNQTGYVVRCTDSSSWSTTSGQIETQTNRVTSISSSSTNSSYPTAKAVYDFVSQNALPSQTGMSGKFLTTNGTTASWASVAAGASIIEKTYSELFAMRGSGTLQPGQLYKITDYVTTTVQTNTRSAGHEFDLIVFATSESTLDCKAVAVLHQNEMYFRPNNADLSKWQIWYDIDNDTSKYAWADSANGKGVIYRMIDEWGNECPYDFKNIQFMVGAKTQPGTVANVYYYTFSVATGTNDATVTDHSFNGTVCYGNTLGKYIMIGTDKIILNFHVFRNTSNSDYCNCNTFGNGCYGNIFGNNCMSNTFGNNCMSNIFGNICNSNTFVNNCSYNIFGNECQANMFGSSCQANRFGSSCYTNTFGNNCGSNTFGNSSGQYGDYCCNNILENGCQYIRLYNTSTSSFNQQLQNITICQGVAGTSSRYIEISSISRNLSYQTKVAKNSNGDLKIYCEADLIQ